MDTTAPELCQLLIDCLKIDSPAVDPARLSALTPEQWRDFLALAATQRVRPLLWHRLKQKGLDHTLSTPAAESLRNAYKRNTMRNLRLYGELRQLLSALKSEEIPLILLKGIYLADAVYESIGLREMNDIDVLARPRDIARIAEILEGMGYVPLQPIRPDITFQTQHHLPGMVKNGVATFEIHWNLTSPNEHYGIDPDSLWEHAVPAHIAGCDVLALSPEDLLLHLCLHTSYQHQFTFGLRPSCDIAAMIAHFGSALDWRSLVERSCVRGWERGVYLALRLANELVDAKVPGYVLEKLRSADMTEAMFETAWAQIFNDRDVTMPISATLAELLESKSLWDKIRIFHQRIFLPKAMIAAQYSVPMDSPKIYGCYLLRFFYLLRRYGQTLIRYHEQNDAPLQASVARTNQISNWLTGSTTTQK